MQKYPTTCGKTKGLKVSEFKKRKAEAYACGCRSKPYPIEFLFEQEYYSKGQADDHRLREEQKAGMR